MCRAETARVTIVTISSSGSRNHPSGTAFAMEGIGPTSQICVRPAGLDPGSLEARVFDEIDVCYRRANEYYGRVFEVPHVTFDLRGRAAGQYNHKSTSIVGKHHHRLRFNRVLLYQEGDRLIDRTVAHEIAHHIAFLLHGPRVAHGLPWQQIMIKVFKKDASRCHSFDVTRTMREVYIYSCDCRDKNEHPVGRRQHQNILKGGAYKCRRCRGKLKFVHRRDPSTGHAIHELEVKGLFVALDDGWCDLRCFENKLEVLLRGERPGKVYLFNCHQRHPVLREWTQRHKLHIVPNWKGDMPAKLPDQKIEITHAIGFTASPVSDVARHIQMLAKQGVKTRLLKI